jgi:hypothetical protein
LKIQCTVSAARRGFDRRFRSPGSSPIWEGWLVAFLMTRAISRWGSWLHKGNAGNPEVASSRMRCECHEGQIWKMAWNRHSLSLRRERGGRVPRKRANPRSSRFRRALALGTGAGLGVMVVMVVVMVVPSGRERRACTDQHQKRDKDDLLHAMKIARTRTAVMPRKMQESSPPRVPRKLPFSGMLRSGQTPRLTPRTLVISIPDRSAFG